MYERSYRCDKPVAGFFLNYDIFLVLQIETEYGKGAWSGDIYLDVVAFPGEGKMNLMPTKLKTTG